MVFLHFFPPKLNFFTEVRIYNILQDDLQIYIS